MIIFVFLIFNFIMVYYIIYLPWNVFTSFKLKNEASFISYLSILTILCFKTTYEFLKINRTI